MQRCIQLATAGAGYVAPNPMVGAVLVHENRIIGEGYHQAYGGPHAEVHCLNSVSEADRHLISQSVMYVSLEPCAHFGKTPPCADLIIEKKVPQVVIGCRDPFKQVDGKGVEKLQTAGVQVTIGVLQQECRSLNKRFITFHKHHRPYIILKWAQTANGKMAGDPGGERLLISNEFTNRLVHKWRSEEAAILVGTNTALFDDPALTNRLWNGPGPVRLVVDMNLRLPSSLQLFNKKVRTIVFNSLKHEEQENLLYYQVTHDVNPVHQILNALYQLKIQSVLVEGGAQLLQSFIDEGLWDEMRVITNNEQVVGHGLPAPRMLTGQLQQQETLFSDTLHYFVNPQTLVH
ncbi:bifunctional diaminohydroxyphosphoribosylaminopyrimidine deaminase/5-amino-6-(5-phosphoribosylamino)uracil reductase RibD [Niastella caeni]|uniref:Riboflavin biosynthesis protein RibD n=2 Tax=Niastella caeni TaxID=2569763 RepID=A0A4S8HW89_9BACT|nr:bifunctional diaminohydroxyphosphoribosylaminopyrimidine deaminase/5-amino-6-(5-phosphoribosylamino)uracil reductase RibD [Niastella caeni]